MSASDRYRRVRKLGEGGAGVVWLVEDQLRPGTLLALKELAESSRGREEGLRREFSTLASLRHPNLAEVHELDLAPETGLPRFTLEFIEGDDLVTAVRREGPAAFFELVAEALRTLAFLHDFGLVHRDLKPGNLLVRRTARLGCRLVVLDFGLAVQSSTDDFAGIGAAGTLPYLAPELLRGAPPSRRTDLYAIAAVLFEAVHGRPPFVLDGTDSQGFIEQVQAGLREPPAAPEGYPPGLAGWLTEMLSADPALRPAQASEALARMNSSCGTRFPSEVAASRAARLASGAPAGRDAEIARLWELLAPSDAPKVVLVCGASGSGKSRLLRWLAGEAVLRETAVFLPPPGLVLPEDAKGRPDPTSAFLETVRASAAVRPTLVIFDEVESADTQAVRVIDRVAREAHGAPLRVVAGVRPGEARNATVRKLLTDVGVVPTLHRIDLAPFGRAGIRALAERAEGSTAISEARIEWLLEVSEGHPVSAEALLVEGTWEKGGRKRTGMPVAPSVAGRLELLSCDGRRWLVALAALAEGSDRSIARVAQLADEAAREAAQEVHAAGLARQRDGVWYPESRAAASQILGGLDAEEKKATLRRAAEAWVADAGAGADPWRLAQIWKEAGDAERAIDCALRAAQQAERRRDHLEASERLAFVLRLLGRRDPRRAAIRSRHGVALDEVGLYVPAARAYLGAALGASDRKSRADATSRAALALARASRSNRALAVAGRAMELAKGAGSGASKARALQAKGAAHYYGKNLPLALECMELAIRDYRADGDKVGLADALRSAAQMKSELGSDDSVPALQAAIDACLEAGLASQAIRARIGLGIALVRAGRAEEGKGELETAIHAARNLGNHQVEVNARFWLAFLLFDRGEFGDAVPLARETEVLAQHLGDVAQAVKTRAMMANGLAQAGRPAEAAEILRVLIARSGGAVAQEIRDGLALNLAEALLGLPEPDWVTARDLIESATANYRSRRQQHMLLFGLALELERRATPGCPDPLDPVKREFDGLAAQGYRQTDHESVIRACLASSRWYRERGNAEAAHAEATRAVEIADHTDSLALRARGRLALAEALETTGRLDEARRTAREGKGLLDQAGERISDAVLRRDFLAQLPFRRLTELASATPGKEDRRITVLYDLIRFVNSETDPDALLESILDVAIREVRAERGMILLREGTTDQFAVCAARNLDADTEKDAEAFSRGIVAQAGEGRSVLTLDAGHDERFRDLRSVSLYGIRSLMCVPLRSRGRIIGTVYLDTRREGALFNADDLRFLEAFADHAAIALENARRRSALEQENQRLRAAAAERVQLANIVGRSPAMQQVFDWIERSATSELPVLIQGESGTGKELVARAIHALGPLRRKTFLSENCAAITETLLESELFGVTRGAFTGADRDRQGLFELADGGTLFLDEIGEMSPGMQSRLLRVLQEGELRRVGGEKVIKVKVRLIAATNRDLPAEVAAGRFRQDLLYRLQVLTIQLPPLRERPGDVLLLIEHLLSRISQQRGRPAPPVEREVMELLERYSWPGNIRQLENVLQRLALLAGDRPISRELVESDSDLRRALLAPTTPAAVFSLEKSEREQIERALAAAGGRRDQAARLLGISRATIYRKIKEFGLE